MDIEIPCEVRHTTYYDAQKQDRKAILIFDGVKEIWIPWKLVVDYCEDRGKITSVFISEWFAEKEGLI